ncbi:MAG: hypothetical protein QXR87_03370 [Candidatus Hadarchaeales archaeon]
MSSPLECPLCHLRLVPKEGYWFCEGCGFYYLRSLDGRMSGPLWGVVPSEEAPLQQEVEGEKFYEWLEAQGWSREEYEKLPSYGKERFRQRFLSELGLRG